MACCIPTPWVKKWKVLELKKRLVFFSRVSCVLSLFARILLGTSTPFTSRTCSNPNKDVFTRQLLLGSTSSSRNRSSHGSNTCPSVFLPWRFVICTFQQVELTRTFRSVPERVLVGSRVVRADKHGKCKLFREPFWFQANQNCDVNDANFCTHHSFGSPYR